MAGEANGLVVTILRAGGDGLRTAHPAHQDVRPRGRT
jgi:hypothetical protein